MVGEGEGEGGVVTAGEARRSSAQRAQLTLRRAHVRRTQPLQMSRARPLLGAAGLERVLVLWLLVGAARRR